MNWINSTAKSDPMYYGVSTPGEERCKLTRRRNCCNAKSVASLAGSYEVDIFVRVKKDVSPLSYELRLPSLLCASCFFLFLS